MPSMSEGDADRLVPDVLFPFRVRAVTHAERSDFGDGVSFIVA
jgi:hypothetical protein